MSPTRQRRGWIAGWQLVFALGLSACWWRLGSGAGTVILAWLAPQQMNSSQGNSMLSLDGCVTSDRGEVRCGCLAGGMSQVQANLGGRTATFGCDDFLDGGRTGSFTGVTAGTQAFTLTGLGPVFDAKTGTTRLVPLYTAAGSLDVAESSTNLEPAVTLQPGSAALSTGGTGDIALLWTFGGQTCAEAGDPSISVSVGPEETYLGETDAGYFTQTVPCQSQGIDGYRLTGLGPSYQLFTLVATAADGTTWSVSPSAFTNGITESTLRADMVPSAPPAQPAPSPLVLSFGFGADGGTCATAGVDQIRVRISVNQGGLWGAFTFDQTFPCVDPAALPVTVGDGGFGAGPGGAPGPGGGPGFGDCPSPDCSIPTGEYLIYAEGLAGGRATFQLHGEAIWAGPTEAESGLPTGQAQTYQLDLLPVESP